ncbi:MAG TPA: hypothetical protein VEV87_10250 [Chitinophagaceae bacterium]|nr:hypothetical protein [Chitinophagaceae bacterium]
MRPVTLLLLLFVVSGFTANAQFSLIPQIGVENPLTKMTYNDGALYTPFDCQSFTRLALRADYKTKKGHGAFLGIATSRSGVDYNTSSPENGMTQYTASVGDMQVRFEGGYQFNTKPIFFKKQSVSKNTAPAKVATPQRKGCGSYAYKSRCGEKNKVAQKPKADKRLFMRIQPSLGVAFVPGARSGVVTDVKGGQPSYTYEAGGYSTALITGAGFEFGAAKRRLFTVSVNYFQSLSDQSATLVTQSAGKEVVTNFNSRVSGWNASIGIPISLSKSKQQAAKQKTTEVKKTSCAEYYKIKCRKVI